GEVVQGDRRGGGTLGVPTANIEHGEYLLPAEGIYSGRAIGPDGRAYPAAISVGTKPTFGENACVCEVHLIGYQGKLDDYGWMIRLQFHDWIRDQIAYRRVESLVDQLHRDIESIQESGVRG
ncbi:MAG: riboflavin kinase, partial [Planctomycetota bacterium]|nr:riboflavin kinase [Planctomycetota bacterium]